MWFLSLNGKVNGKGNQWYFGALLAVWFFVGCFSKNPISSAGANNPEPPFWQTLPPEYREAILWQADFESGDYSQWEDRGTESPNAGGGIFVTDPGNSFYGLVHDRVHSGRAAGFAQIQNALTPGENKAVRLMRWTDKAWDEGGDYFPDFACYSVFTYFPSVYDPAKPAENDPLGDGGWWNTFQFKSDNNAGSQPVVALDVYTVDGRMYYGLVVKDYPDDNSEDHQQEYITRAEPLSIPVGRWFHLEACLKKSKQYDGEIQVWQEGELLFEKTGIRTLLPPAETTTWGIGNYTDYIEGGTVPGQARVYFDDAIVANRRIGSAL